MATRNRQLIAYVDGEPYYAAQKAEEILGMTYSALRNQVITGNIEAKIPRGKRQLHYQAKDVDELARDLKVFTIQRKNKTTQFTRVKTIEEVKECMEISKSLFGVERGDVAKHMRVIDKNPETYYMLKDEEQVIGYTAIWPIKPEKLNSVLKQT